jgi:hypothetical protein
MTDAAILERLAELERKEAARAADARRQEEVKRASENRMSVGEWQETLRQRELAQLLARRPELRTAPIVTAAAAQGLADYQLGPPDETGKRPVRRGNFGPADIAAAQARRPSRTQAMLERARERG